MKKLILISFFVFLLNSAFAQWSQEWNTKENEHLLYANGNVMVGNSSGGNLGLSFVYKSKFSVEVGYSAGSNQLNNQIPGLKSATKSNEEITANPNDMMENFNIMVGRHFYLNAKETIRFILQGGTGMSMMMNSVNEHPADNSGSFSKNGMVKTKDISIILSSKFEFPITDIFGFTAGPTLIMNQEKRYLGLSVGFIYGIITKV